MSGFGLGAFGVSVLVLASAASSCAAIKDPARSSGSGQGSGGAPSVGGDAGLSGSGGHVVVLPDAGIADGGTFNAETNPDATCGFATFDLQRAPVDLFVVLDRSASMKDDSKGDTANPDAGMPSKWSQVVPALIDVIGAADGAISWGLKTFPEDVPGSTADCQNASVTSLIDVPVASMNARATAVAIGNVTPEGNGTPTGAAIDVATGHLSGLGTTARKYILLATDGEPSCGGVAGALVKDSSTAKSDAVAAVTAAAAAGVHTFVIGVATKSSATKTLDQLATAGLEPRPDPDPAAPKFYLAGTQSDLVSALQAIVAPIASTCLFSLAGPPPDPNNIAVRVGGTTVSQDTGHANGWDYTDAGQAAVQLFGAWCDMVKQDASTVRIVYGCPGFVIP